MTRRAVGILLGAVLGAAVLGAQPERGRPPDLPPWLEDRLGALDPGTPEGYLELGEELAVDPARGRLAERLFVLAFELARRSPGRSDIAASACLALADGARGDEERAWLGATAALIDDRFAAALDGRRADEAVREQTAYRAATVLGLVRAGEGRDARELLEEPAVRALIERYARLLPRGRSGDPMRTLEQQAEAWPCRECHNRRIVVASGSAELCPVCAGDPGPGLSEEQLVAHLRLEARLLAGIQRSWTAQLTVDLGRPLLDPDPEELAPRFGVDPAATVWRQGRWTAPGG